MKRVSSLLKVAVTAWLALGVSVAAVAQKVTENSTVTAGYTYQFQTLDIPGAFATRIFGTNEKGELVGATRANPQSFLHGFLRKSDKSVVMLEPAGSMYSQARGINDHDTIVGLYTDSNGNEHGFIYANGQYTTIDYPGAVITDLFGINEFDVAVGTYTNNDGTFHGFLWSRGKFYPVSCPHAAQTASIGISIWGFVTGDCSSNSPEGFSGFLLFAKAAYRFDYPGALGTIGQGLNAKTQIVGTWDGTDGNTHGFLLDGTGYTRLDYGTVDTFPHAITNEGVIYGFYDNGGPTHGFVATPVSH